jgi:tetratricopeptide (TPR) repeat protein
MESEDEALFLRRIADFWQEGEYQIAKGQMEEFIVQYPKSTYSDPLCAALGDLYLREKNFSNALEWYSQIQTPEFTNRAFLNRMQCLYELQWYSTLSEECEAYLENGPNLYATYFLAISLYHQCLNLTKNPEQLAALAEKAKPHFETLFKSELSNEIAQGYAHLCCLLKDFEKASLIYLDLANKDPALQEEMLFQVALIQSEYDKNQALQTFDQIAKLGQTKAKEAAYNRLVIAYDLGRYEDLTQENLLSQIPSEKIEFARLLIGQSLIQLKKYETALTTLKTVLEQAAPSEVHHATLLALIDASYQAGNLPELNIAIEKLTLLYPDDSQLPKAYFSRAQIQKKNQNLAAAKEDLEKLLAQFPQFEQKAQVVFELTHLDHKTGSWETCYHRAHAFLTEFPDHAFSLFAWRYYISSSAELARKNPQLRDQLISDLEIFLKLTPEDQEKGEWQLLLAKTHYEMKEYSKAMSCLETLQTPNAHLLLALCQKELKGDLHEFCSVAETAIEEGANLIDLGQIHASLFNAHIELSQMDKAATHLYSAFQAGADIKPENLLWLADLYLGKLNEDETQFVIAHRAAQLLDKCKAALHHPEAVIPKLAKVYSLLGRTDEEIALLESVESPELETQLLLAQGYAKKGIIEKATPLFDAIVASSATLRSPIAAAASLQSARLKMNSANPDLTQIATQLKNLVVQKNIEGEPYYLEAALDYVALQAGKDLGKKFSLLKKTKIDFEKGDDLLSKDYQEARLKSPRKDKMVRGYLQLMDAEILAAAEPENKAKVKALLLQIINEQTASALLQRARMLLTSIDEPVKS